MFHRILVPVDGSLTSNRGLDEAITLARDHKAKLCLLHVVDDLAVAGLADTMTYVPPSYIERFREGLRTRGKKVLAGAEAKARKRGVSVEAVLLEALGRQVAEQIIDQAKQWRADLVVIGTHGRRGFSRLVMGSDAEMVVRETPVPVLLVRSSPRPRRSSVRRR
jgi:nucleotide-binding universal stress UspA family protein